MTESAVKSPTTRDVFVKLDEARGYFDEITAPRNTGNRNGWEEDGLRDGVWVTPLGAWQDFSASMNELFVLYDVEGAGDE